MKNWHDVVSKEIIENLQSHATRRKPIAEEVVLEGKKKVDERERKKVTEYKIRSNCSEEFSLLLIINEVSCNQQNTSHFRFYFISIWHDRK